MNCISLLSDIIRYVWNSSTGCHWTVVLDRIWLLLFFLSLFLTCPVRPTKWESRQLYVVYQVYNSFGHCIRCLQTPCRDSNVNFIGRADGGHQVSFKICSGFTFKFSMLFFKVPFKFTWLHVVVCQDLGTHYPLRFLMSRNFKPKLQVRFIVIS